MVKNIDIRQHGSGNVGATNVFRVFGKGPGIFVLVFDILKGVIAVALVPDMLGMADIFPRILMSLAVVGGHNWTCFLQFKGGKGIATSLGVLIGLTIKIAVIRPVLLLTVLTWVVCFLISGFVSLSSIIAATALPIFMIFTNQSFSVVLLGVVFCVFVVLRHKPNIKRLLAGQEPKVLFNFNKKPKI
jgi:glycerol-3-phosphate acyltransferase PlsY